MNLITGGLGFIGNELVRQLSQAGEAVAILDNRNRVAPRIEDLDGVAVREVDITDREATAKAVRELKPRAVFHLAAIHYIPECNANPERTLRVNVEGTMSLLSACSAAGVEHFLCASSGAVYADSPEPLTESSPVGPVDVYGWSKWFAEELCRWHARQSGLRVTSCRLFNNYGPRETNRHIIPEILAQLKSGDRLMLGNTKPQRDYIHTSDCARALRLLAKLKPEPTRTVNISSSHHASVDDLIGLLGGILGRKLEVVTDPARFRKADKMVQVADISLLQQLTGWRPEVSLRQGLADLLKFEGLLK
jgi:UDP-glucose 4-epimerase